MALTEAARTDADVEAGRIAAEFAAVVTLTSDQASLLAAKIEAAILAVTTAELERIIPPGEH